jgi:hypothetical protein
VGWEWRGGGGAGQAVLLPAGARRDPTAGSEAGSPPAPCWGSGPPPPSAAPPPHHVFDFGARPRGHRHGGIPRPERAAPPRAGHEATAPQEERHVRQRERARQRRGRRRGRGGGGGGGGAPRSAPAAGVARRRRAAAAAARRGPAGTCAAVGREHPAGWWGVTRPFRAGGAVPASRGWVSTLAERRDRSQFSIGAANNAFSGSARALGPSHQPRRGAARARVPSRGRRPQAWARARHSG